MTVRAFLCACLAIAVAAAPATASPFCISTQTTGSGEKFFSTCVTDTGNVARFITPSGVDHLNIDGYAICDGGGLASARAYNKLGFTESNFAPATTHTST